MPGKRRFMAAWLGLSLVFVGGCDGADATDDDIGERDDQAGDDVAATDEDPCERIDDAADCLAKPGCGMVFGKQLVENAVGWCTAPNEQFLACISTTATCTEPDPADCEQSCLGIEQTVCFGDGYYRASGCLPADSLCPAPGEITGDCSGGDR